jgi:phosphate-selective porin OprO and OprP
MPRVRRLVSMLAAGLFAAAAAMAQEKPQEGAGSIVVKPAGKEPTLTLGGLIQAQGDFGDRGDSRFSDANDRFYLRRARLNATGRFLEEFDFRLEMDLAGSLSNTSGMRAQMTDGYINWNRFAAVNVRAGQFKTPFGFEQLYADPRLLTIERSLANDRLTLNRQIGVQVAGELLDKRLGYAAGAFNGSGVNTNANDNGKFLWVGRLSAVPWRAGSGDGAMSWSVGGNAFTTEDTALSQPSEFRFDSTPATADRDNLFTGKRKGYGVDTQVLVGPFELWAEALQVRWEATDGRPRPTLESDGWYVQASVYAVPKKLQVVAKYETFDPNRDASKDETNTATLGLNYYIKGHDLKLMLDWMRVDVVSRTSQESKLLARLQVAF